MWGVITSGVEKLRPNCGRRSSTRIKSTFFFAIGGANPDDRTLTCRASSSASILWQNWLNLNLNLIWCTRGELHRVVHVTVTLVRDSRRVKSPLA